MVKWAFAWIVAVAVLYTLDDASGDRDPYCEMVAVYKETGGRYGWPDYRGNAAEVCK